MWTLEPDVDDLRLAQAVALALAGSVPIPSPVPAVATVLLGRTPKAASALLLSKENDYYVRVVRCPSPHVIVSLYIAAGDVRLIKGLIAKKEAGKDHPEFSEKPRILLGADLLSGLEALKKGLAEEGPAGEQLLAKEAVVYVPAMAKVQVRTDRVTTAEECEMATTGCEPYCPDECPSW